MLVDVLKEALKPNGGRSGQSSADSSDTPQIVLDMRQLDDFVND